MTLVESANPNEIEKMNFETAMAELENVVRRLERGDVPLDEAVKIYERGSLLKKHCEKKLSEAEGKVQKLILQKDGTVEGTEPFG